MGLLAPLYALAALAIAGPILFHLIRRQPQGQMPFSSLMFLTPSPPRLTRRSRLDNWLLLLLRMAAIALIAFAFARPYLRQESFLNSSLTGRTIVALLDTSASMQRTDVWNQAIDELQDLIESLSPEDRLALFTISDTLTPVVPLESPQQASSLSSVEAVRGAIDDLQPTWRKTELAAGLTAVADLLNAAAISGQIDANAETEIVLISDLHTGSGLEALQGFPWPESIAVDVRQIRPAVAGNARASWMADVDADSVTPHSQTIKLRVENNADSQQQTFELAWADAEGPLPGASTTVQVPAGQVRIVPLTARPSGATQVRLAGDAWDGDNVVYMPEVKPTRQQIAFLGPNVELAELDLAYFLKKAPLNTPRFEREVVAITAAELLAGGPAYQAIVVEPDATSLSLATQLRSLAEAGATLIVSLARPVDAAPPLNDFLRSLLGLPEIEVGEAQVRNFALISNIDYTHPVFAPFADPRFNDFSKIRVWKHRTLSLPASAKLTIVAGLDDQSPLLLEQRVGKGRVWLLTTGWQPESSSLALSSKFVPMLLTMLDPSGRGQNTTDVFEVGELISAQGEDGVPDVLAADGAPLASDQWTRVGPAVSVHQPGLFQLQLADSRRPIAVQVPAVEGQQTPLDSDIFEQYGVTLGQVDCDEKRRESSRQLKLAELENKQRLWQWLIAAALGVLAVETWLAGSLARRHARQLAAS